MSDPILRIENLSVALPEGLDRQFAVQNLSLEVHRRQIVCVVGESGSGKSVTAAAVMRLLPEKVLRISGGTIRLEGVPFGTGESVRIVLLARLTSGQSRHSADEVERSRQVRRGFTRR